MTQSDTFMIGVYFMTLASRMTSVFYHQSEVHWPWRSSWPC